MESKSVIDEVRLSAYNNEPEPKEDWKPPEIVLWYAFRELYRAFHARQLNKEGAEKVKAEILKRYQVQKTEYETLKRLVRNQAEMWKKIELAGNRYGTERTIESADAFYKAVYDVELKEANDGKEMQELRTP